MKKFEGIHTDSSMGIFNEKSLPLVAPDHLPRQTNSVDCGAFVCRYPRDVLALQNESFQVITTYNNGERNHRVKKNVSDKISKCEAFKFCMSDIEGLRKEFVTLIDKRTLVF